jgi:hypothetical protein
MTEIPWRSMAWHVAGSDREATVVLPAVVGGKWGWMAGDGGGGCFLFRIFFLSRGAGWVRPSGFGRKLVKKRFLLFLSQSQRTWSNVRFIKIPMKSLHQPFLNLSFLFT